MISNGRIFLSKAIVFLLAIRIPLNLLHWVSLGEFHGYDITILTLWSGVFLILVCTRLFFPPFYSDITTKLLLLFIAYFMIFGLPRFFSYKTIILENLFTLQFMLAILVAPRTFHDLSLDYIVDKIYYASVTLIIIHSTTFLWKSDIFGDLLNYIGLFPNKFLLGQTFFSIIPFMYLRYQRSRNVIDFAFLLLTIVFLFWSFRRMTIVAFLLGIASFLLINRSFKLLFATFILSIIMFNFIPTEIYDTFLRDKILYEYNVYLSGDYEEIGSGRIGMYYLGFEEFMKLDTLHKLIGLGSAQSWALGEIIWGSPRYTHAQIIATLYDYGIIGLSLLLVLLYYLIKYALSNAFDTPDGIGGVSIYSIVSSITICLTGIFLASGGTSVLISFLLGYPIYYKIAFYCKKKQNA